MKNANYIETICKCYMCEKPGFFCTTPSGVDYTTCPLCRTGNDELTEYQLDCLEQLEYTLTVDNSFSSELCPVCLILYDTGCIHSHVGCTADVYNGHIISKWRHCTTGFIYDGMPQFDSIQEVMKCGKDVEILEITCLNNEFHCTKTYHPIPNPSIRCKYIRGTFGQVETSKRFI